MLRNWYTAPIFDYVFVNIPQNKSNCCLVKPNELFPVFFTALFEGMYCRLDICRKAASLISG